MTSYKIHSIKDSEKLSFIIEGEDEKVLTQKLSAEGHIILSVEKIDTSLENLFCFEGKKPDGSFLEGKISADNIFTAYEMLKKEYKYTITKLYPEIVTEKEKQEKIFSDLLATFQETETKKPKIISDTSKQALAKYKNTLAKLTEILQKEQTSGSEGIIADLKKLDQNNNATAIEQELTRLLKEFRNKRENKAFFTQVRPLMKEMKIFVLPDICFSILNKTFNLFKSLDPLVHPREVTVQRHLSTEHPSDEAIRKEYESVHNNPHIHTFLQKKYRPKISPAFKEPTKKYYTYTLLREKKILLMIKKILRNLQKTCTVALLSVALLLCTIVFFGLYGSVYVSTQVLIIFLIFVAASLVIQSETV